MRKYVVITTQFPAIHNWPDCDIKEVGFLSHSHRHIFHITMKFEVSHNNREIEFLYMKKKLDDWIDDNYRYKHLGSKSCEDIATELLKKFAAYFVSVFEDEENGAEVYEDNKCTD